MHKIKPSPLPARYILLLLAGISLPLATPVQATAYELVWSDEFEVDGLPDPANWSYDVGGWGWGNFELQYYTEAESKNARVENGFLIIEAHEESVGDNNYTSARLLTQDKHEWAYGKFEARIKVPAGTGLWPAFWMLGDNFDVVGWPDCGEIDIMEFVGREPNEIFGTIHGPGYSGGLSFSGEYIFPEPVSNDFHIFTVEWKPGEIRWYVDGIHYHTAVPADIRGTGRTPREWVFDHPFFIILNLAIGGTFGGILDPDLEFPVRMLVDYVRVYERAYGPLSDFPAVGDWVDTGDLLGWVNVAHYPWVFIEPMESYARLAPEEPAGGAWMFLPSPIQ